MLNLTEIKALHKSVMFEEDVLQSALPIFNAMTEDEISKAAFDFGTLVITTTLSKLSEHIAEIPNVEQISEMIFADILAGFDSLLDSPDSI